MLNLPPELSLLVTVILAVAGIVWTFAWWLSNKFNSMMATFYNKIDSVGAVILDKLEYHEKHDDKRFQQVSNDIWDIRVRNAARDKSFSNDVKKVDTQTNGS